MEIGTVVHPLKNQIAMKYVLPAFLLAINFSCGSTLKTTDGQTIDLSAYNEWPRNLSIETYEGGGMNPEWNTTFISMDSCYVISSREQLTNKYYFKLTQAELNKLLADLMRNRIDKLGTEEAKDIIYDKGTTSITITLDRKIVTLGDGATERITEARKGDFFSSYELINALAKNKISVERKKCCFYFDNSLKKLRSKQLSVICMTGDTSFSDSTQSLKEKICFSLLRGRHGFQIHVTKRGKVQYTDYVSSLYPQFELKGDTSFTLSILNDTVLVMK